MYYTYCTIHEGVQLGQHFAAVLHKVERYYKNYFILFLQYIVLFYIDISNILHIQTIFYIIFLNLFSK